MRHVCAALVAVGVARIAAAQCSPTVLFTNYTILPSGVVPGISPVTRFAAGSNPTNPYQQIAVSPQGNYWVLRAAAGTSSGHVIVRGVGRTRAGAQLIVRRTVTPVLGTRTCDTLGEHVDVNDAGVVAFTGDLSGSIADDSFVARWNGTFTLAVREGQQLLGSPYGFGIANNGPTLLDDGRLVHSSDLLTGSANLSAIVSVSSGGGEVLTLTGSTTPLQQQAQPAQPLWLLAPVRVASSSDGVSRVFFGTLAGPTSTNAVLMHNDTVLAQKTFVIPGSGLASAYERPATGTAVTQCAPTGGFCAARVTMNDGVDAILNIQQGLVSGTLARTGEPVTPGSTEVYADAQLLETFLACALASNGDWVVIGTTSETDLMRDTVLVFRGTRVLLREGDEIDLNEDGQFNDNAFVGGFAQDGLALSDNGDIYVTVSVRGAAGNATGSALLTLRTPRCNDVDFNNDEVFPSDDDVVDFFNVLAGASCPACDSIDFNNDCVFPSDDDVIAFFNVLAGGACTP